MRVRLWVRLRTRTVRVSVMFRVPRVGSAILMA